ncbi:GNAT family N-acetyltransferase [Sinorhizobium medicae]|uniref:GNAT family N-acetyltransferase n=1 Tax=Sinorhizobium medicae TaxID=110321 RepID=UPI000FD9F331|nr:GNAT family N-acetyltransferase [Sinorhizobium medicae]MDX0517181.1 GNAT family N-acetyltransferase [Sinorhizobium medicae]MDX0603775.1 GNAT family N-acetyltransferase [Sinorhizobium medicae]MDX0617351.1 GNAT family N-acetyltransferase [Sinorhizobium medicae]MDX0623051.1 GNAT family N-acetyltransferase [Sinorhizobium medicae]MDX0665942.1 GNAT family N-acetyltransferase [Sinorhizobium medicae]
MKSPSQIADSESDQHTAEVPYRVHFYENCSQSPASWLVPQATLEIEEIEERGFHDRTHSPPIFTSPCVAAIGKDGKAIAMINYCGETIWNIFCSYVVPKHRRKRIHSALFEALREKGLQQGNIVSINCMTHVNNLAAQAAFEAQGRTKEYIMYTYPLKDRSDAKEPTVGEMRMPEYLVEPFDTGPDGLKGMQAFINEKTAEGYELHQAIERSTYQWVLIFKLEPDRA